MEPTRFAKAASCAGRSLLEILWEELDAVMDRLMEDLSDKSALTSRERVAEMIHGGDSIGSGKGGPALLKKVADEVCTHFETRGQAQGLAYAIAVITTPYEPSVPAIKKIAKKRWESRQ